MSKKIATLNSLRSNDERDDSGQSGGESDGDDPHQHQARRGQAFFVGGSEHSGQEVLGPPRPRNTNEEETSRLFASARAHGAETVSNADEPGSGPKTTTTLRFPSSGGYRLGDRATPSQPRQFNSGGEATTTSPAAAAAAAAPAMRDVTLRAWNNGFTIDDGPLRQFQDPANRDILMSIQQGRIPRELMQLYPQQEINLKMERKAEDYKAPKLQPFSGQGQRLGGLVPTVNTAPPPPPSTD